MFCVSGRGAAYGVALLAGDAGGVGVLCKLSTMRFHAAEHVGKQIAGTSGCVGAWGVATGGKVCGTLAQAVSSSASSAGIAARSISLGKGLAGGIGLADKGCMQGFLSCGCDDFSTLGLGPVCDGVAQHPAADRAHDASAQRKRHGHVERECPALPHRAHGMPHASLVLTAALPLARTTKGGSDSPGGQR